MLDDEAYSAPLVDFVRQYAGGAACLLLGSSVIASNGLFQPDLHAPGLIYEVDHGVRNPLVISGNVRWAVTRLAHGGGRYSICTSVEESKAASIGLDRQASTDSTSRKHARTPPGFSVGYEPIKKMKHPGQPASETVQAAAVICKRWRALEVPGLDYATTNAHIDLIQNVDWGNTALGPMDAWGEALLSIVGQALASPFPVALMWGASYTLIYNFFYGLHLGHKHPEAMGGTMQEAFPEIWDTILGPICRQTMEEAKPVHFDRSKIFLDRYGYLEESHFSWSLIPILATDNTVIGIYNPNFDDTQAVLTERRINLLRETSQSFDLDSTPASMFQRVCQTIERDPLDIPIIAIYDCSASDLAADSALNSSIESASIKEQSAHSEGGDQDMRMVEEMEQRNQAVTFFRTATAGIKEESKVFPSRIPPEHDEDVPTLATHPSFLEHFRAVQRLHKTRVIQREELEPFVEHMERTALDDEITCVVLLPITTSDDKLRAIAIVCLNPRRQYDDNYEVFLDLFKAQLSHGITSIRLVKEEVERSKFYAALINQKNEELAQMLDARTSELRASERKFSKLAGLAPIGIWRCEVPSGLLTFCNEQWWRITGHSREAGMNRWPESIHEEDLPGTLVAFQDILATGSTRYPVEFRWKTRAGEEPRWAAAQAAPETDDEGNLVAVTGVLADWTEKKKIELYERTRAEEAIELRKAQENVIDVISHEMRNPLSAISLSTDASIERVQTMLSKAHSAACIEDMKEIVQDLETVSHCCGHLKRLTDDFLLLSKIDHDFLVITPIPSLLTDSIRKTLAMFTSELLSKQITCTLEVTTAFKDLKVDWVFTDPSRVSQLLINVLTNAIKFTAQSETRRITVKVDCSPSRPYLEGTPSELPGTSPTKAINSPAGTPKAEEPIFYIVSVSDTGLGISEEEMKGLFQRFRQASEKTHISYGGSGLGLFICRRLAMLFGGEIGVTSERGKGSTFTFYIQTRRCAPSSMEATSVPSPGSFTVTGPAQEVAQRASTPSPIPHSASSAPLTPLASKSQPLPENIHVLIVEDNLVNQQLLNRHLTRSGCSTATSNHGQEAIDALKTSDWVVPGGKRIDMVLMDIEMPVLDGLSAIKIIRQMEIDGTIRGHVPILAVSANARQEQVEKMITSGFDGTISKPFKIPDILQRMRDLLLREKVHRMEVA